MKQPVVVILFMAICLSLGEEDETAKNVCKLNDPVKWDEIGKCFKHSKEAENVYQKCKDELKLPKETIGQEIGRFCKNGMKDDDYKKLDPCMTKNGIDLDTMNMTESEVKERDECIQSIIKPQ